jgi:4a-hydroxytetrahydrobiopterin dehydratase
MDASHLTQGHCVPCEGGVDPLKPSEYQQYLDALSGWAALNEKSITKDFKFKNFKAALEFINKVGEIAEREGHHPDIYLHNWNKVRLTLSTHAIHGLSMNDFILAAKVETIQ